MTVSADPVIHVMSYDDIGFKVKSPVDDLRQRTAFHLCSRQAVSVAVKRRLKMVYPILIASLFLGAGALRPLVVWHGVNDDCAGFTGSVIAKISEYPRSARHSVIANRGSDGFHRPASKARSHTFSSVPMELRVHGQENSLSRVRHADGRFLPPGTRLNPVS